MFVGTRLAKLALFSRFALNLVVTCCSSNRDLNLQDCSNNGYRIVSVFVNWCKLLVYNMNIAEPLYMTREMNINF